MEMGQAFCHSGNDMKPGQASCHPGNDMGHERAQKLKGDVLQQQQPTRRKWEKGSLYFPQDLEGPSEVRQIKDCPKVYSWKLWPNASWVL